MSLRCFVSLCSLLLVVWLSLAFVRPGVVEGGGRASDDAVNIDIPESAETDDLTVSVSP